jgi:diguanylate cyclase (GGDEF)-like protein
MSATNSEASHCEANASLNAGLNANTMAPAGREDRERRGHGAAGVSDLSAINIARIDALIATRLAKLQLPADLLVLFYARIAHSSRLGLSSWANWAAGFGALSLFMGFACLPPWLINLSSISSCIVTVSFLAAAQVIRRKIFDRQRDFIVCAPVVFALVLALPEGCFSHQANSFLIDVIMSMAVVWSFIAYVQVQFAVTVGIALLTMLLLAGFTAVSALPNAAEKCLLVAFLLATTGGMVNARWVQNLYRYRVFLLQLRDEMRSGQMAELNAQLAGIAYTDRLTDVPNRRFFDEKMVAMRADPKGHLPLAICLIDIDHFKLLNDSLGHQQGDRCLQMVAGALRQNLRAKTDLLARYGGEEFVVILPQTDFVTAMQLVERLRLAVRFLHHPNPEAPLGLVTMSAGVAIADGDGFDPEALLTQADRALYRAKSAGRDQICV